MPRFGSEMGGGFRAQQLRSRGRDADDFAPQGMLLQWIQQTVGFGPRGNGCAVQQRFPLPPQPGLPGQDVRSIPQHLPVRLRLARPVAVQGARETIVRGDDEGSRPDLGERGMRASSVQGAAVCASR